MSGVNLTMINSDGTAGRPTAQDTQLFERAQALITADANFQALHAPTLARAEVNAGQQDTEAGYLYFRYDVPGNTPQEFWAHWGSRDRVAWKSGQISVAT
jgi:hypothetical protein